MKEELIDSIKTSVCNELHEIKQCLDDHEHRFKDHHMVDMTKDLLKIYKLIHEIVVMKI